MEYKMLNVLDVINEMIDEKERNLKIEIETIDKINSFKTIKKLEKNVIQFEKEIEFLEEIKEVVINNGEKDKMKVLSKMYFELHEKDNEQLWNEMTTWEIKLCDKKCNKKDIRKKLDNLYEKYENNKIKSKIILEILKRNNYKIKKDEK